MIKNYITGALLYYGHLCMRKGDTVCDEELWQGTAKSAEGHLSEVLWAKAKEEGLKVEVSWQDADSSSAKGFRQSYSNEQESRIMLCGGHVGRAHGKKLEELQLNLSNVVVLAKIIHWLPLETNLFGDVLVWVSSKMQNETTTVPWSMLETVQINTNKLCWLLESTTAEIFMNGGRIPAAFIHSLYVAVKSVRWTLMDFMQNLNVLVRITTQHTFCDVNFMAGV